MMADNVIETKEKETKSLEIRKKTENLGNKNIKGTRIRTNM